MKKIFAIGALLLGSVAMFAQPQLTKDNIDEVIGAMTLEETANSSGNSIGKFKSRKRVLFADLSGKLSQRLAAFSFDINAIPVYVFTRIHFGC